MVVLHCFLAIRANTVELDFYLIFIVNDRLLFCGDVLHNGLNHELH